MVTEKQLEIIRKIQQVQHDLERGMSDRLPVIFSGLTQQVFDLTNDMPLEAKRTAKNIRAIIDLKAKIAATIVQNIAYRDEVKRVTEGFKELKKLSDSYFSELIDGFKAKDELYKAILEANVETTTDLLLGSGIKENFGNAIREVLKANNAGQGKRSELQKTLKEFIEGTPDQKAYLDRYIKQTTSDAVYTFSREYNAVISDDLGLNHGFYAGTIISDSRPFCKARAGRYFKKSSVQSWADLGDWNGKKAGTTKVTIFSYLGGWGCLHDYFPVSKAQYEAAKKKGLAELR